jgi:two-component system, chemotaxis family, response regulator Rcp1
VSDVWLPRVRSARLYSTDRLRRDDSDARPIEILLVEDNPGDARLTIEALRDGKVSNSLSVAHDGLEALAFVRRQRHFAAAPRPDLILLDLDLPVKDGREVLAEIKADPELRAIPVVIMTISRAESDMLRAQQLDVRAYITKPVDLRQFIDVIHSIEEFWVSAAVFPHEWQPSLRS